MEFVPENVQGALFYSGMLDSFLSFGLFTLFALGLAFSGFFPRYARKYVALIALPCAALQWVFLVVDVQKYGAPWYYGLLDPFRAIVDPASYSGLTYFSGLVLPSIGIIATTGLAFVFVAWAVVLDRDSPKMSSALARHDDPRV